MVLRALLCKKYAAVIYAYIDAADKAFKDGIDRTTLSIEESYGTDCRNDGYKDSFGVQLEGIC